MARPLCESPSNWSGSLGTLLSHSLPPFPVPSLLWHGLQVWDNALYCVMGPYRTNTLILAVVWLTMALR